MTNVSLDELGQIRVPDFERDRITEQIDSSFVDLYHTISEYSHTTREKERTLKLSSQY